ncbi:hypothetical protein O6H91_10G027400 [Diphasiastrum complanatum]|uniref:Uncharacterized protein n=1 Tax=Diphasiastrum complanatum TaxID=34168 RepID=A0ACC2CFH6_DIPCM|nr:hypothetical protein O6H91_10G027400 [Diphasiastrum complanatum]
MRELFPFRKSFAFRWIGLICRMLKGHRSMAAAIQGRGRCLWRAMPPPPPSLLHFAIPIRYSSHNAQAQSPLSSSSAATAAGADSADADPNEKAASASAAAAGSGGGKHLWRNFKIMMFLTTTAASAGVAYATYAYSTVDIEDKIATLRSSTGKRSLGDNLLHRVQEALYSTSVQAAVATAELYLKMRKAIEDQVRGFTAPSSDKLLPDLPPNEQHVYTLVVDLNETLVYSDWKRDRGWGTFKRPGVDAFLEQLAQFYEIVIYSDQLNFYVDPILERLDQKGCIRYRLTRDATQYINGKHLRDLSKLNRDPAKILYLSGHAPESCLQLENAVPIKPWKLESDDTALLDLLPFLEFVARQRPPDVRAVLASYQGQDIATEFRERTRQNLRRMQERKQQSRFWRGSGVNQTNQ